MPRKKKEIKAEEVKVEEPKEVSENINEMRGMYDDFKETLSAVVGDSGDFAKKHKWMFIIGFLLFLWNRNRTFTIDGFVKKLEDNLAGGGEW